ncbi:type IV secretory system conjugative DNA transfer family protein [Hyphobacterium sp.]|uniref:type IV secretory system conjugative DNA transfer family protein n=1 Tax=Hyphobacterium sp. TaxID=2004662 RepID=UPI003BA9EDE3
MNHPDNLGSAEWADIDDIAERYPYNPETDIWLGRHPFNFDQSIGYIDDRHVFLCAGSGGGKGRAMVINNLLNWRGSIVSIDPKGENASVCAARRADGDEYCTGLGQKTYVLDPYNLAQVPEELRASCNLMDAIDTSGGSVLSQAEILAEGMRIEQKGGESESWSKEGAQITALVIAHVKTMPELADHSRDLVMVRDLLIRGVITQDDRENSEFNQKERKLAEAENRQPNLRPVNDPYETLFRLMLDNPAQNGAIQKRARGLLNLMRSNVRQWGSLIQNARMETNFIDELEMEEQLISSSNKRSFNIADLKDSEEGISIFLCLPDDARHPAVRWQKALLAMIVGYMKKRQGMPRTNRQVLMVIDEFASMGKMDDVIHGMTSVRGAGIKLFVIVTSSVRMKAIYEEEWMELLAGSSIQMWFQIDDPKTGKIIEEIVGDAHVTLNARSQSRAEQEGWSESEAEGETKGESESEARGESDTTSESQSHGKSQTHNMSVSTSDATSWTRSKSTSQADTVGSGSSKTHGSGTSSTHGYSKSWQLSDSSGVSENSSATEGSSTGQTSVAGLFGPYVQSTNSGLNSSKTKGFGTNKSTSTSQGGSSNQSSTTSTNVSGTISTNRSSTKTVGSTEGVGGSHTKTKTEGSSVGETQTETIGTSSTLSKTYTKTRNISSTTTKTSGRSGSVTNTEGLTESFHKRPLITYTEMNIYLSRVDIRDHPAYPGLALVRISGEHPFLTRRCYYDQDPAFEGLFTPHYAHAESFMPFSQQRLVGGQYTSEHFVALRLPAIAMESGIKLDVELHLLSDDWFEKGEKLFTWRGPTSESNHEFFNELDGLIPFKMDALNKGDDGPLQEEYISPYSMLPSAKSFSKPVTAPVPGKVIDYALQPAFEEKGDIALIRTETILDEEQRAALQKRFFSGFLLFLKKLARFDERYAKLISELNEEYVRDWQSYQDGLREQAEKERRAREAEEKRAREQEYSRALAERKHKIARLYGVLFLIIGILLPSAGIMKAGIEVRLDPEPFTATPVFETQGFNSTEDGSMQLYRHVFPNVHGAEPLEWLGGCRNRVVVRQHIFGDGYDYRCDLVTGHRLSRGAFATNLVLFWFVSGMLLFLIVAFVVSKFARRSADFEELADKGAQRALIAKGITWTLNKTRVYWYISLAFFVFLCLAIYAYHVESLQGYTLAN